MQTFGDFLGFNPHCHILVTDGCFYGDRGMFRVATPLEMKKLEAIPRSGRGQASGTSCSRCFWQRASRETIAMLSTWRYSGFHVFWGLSACDAQAGNRVSPNDATAMENLARYIIRKGLPEKRQMPSRREKCATRNR